MISRIWSSFSPWIGLAISGCVGVSGAALAALWVPGRWAIVAGGAVAAVAAVFSRRAGQWLDERWQANKALPENLAVRNADGSMPLVREVADPTLLGVHRAESWLDAQDAATAVVPVYVRRDIDDRLRGSVRRGGFVLVLGESAAGKSRAAYEAMRSEAAGYRLAVPSGRRALPVVVASLADAVNSVLWLDDLERFIGPGGITPAMVADLIAGRKGRVTVLATIRTAEYDRFAARGEVAVEGEDRQAWRDGAAVLRSATVVPLSRPWSPAELERAADYSGDPRIARALERSQIFGVAETLAAGPELVSDWRNAWAAGAHPRAAALVAAAVDCRRAGLDDPVPRQMLELLHEHYLRSRGGAALRPETLEDAWRWAVQPVRGASSLIVPADSDAGHPRFVAFDYLIDLRDLEPVPSQTWQLLLEHADADYKFVVATNVYYRIRSIFLDAVEAGTVGDVFLKASAAADRGDYLLAIGLLEGEISRHDPPQSLFGAPMHQVAFYKLQAGSVDEALEMFSQILKFAEANLPPEDEYLRVVRHNIASCRELKGDLVGALNLFREILADRERHLGPHAMNTLATRGRIAGLIAKLGNPQEAVVLTEQIIAEETRALGKDHTNTLLARHSLASLRAGAGDLAGAIATLVNLLPDLAAAFGGDHPEVLKARLGAARYLAKSGRRADARVQYSDLLGDLERIRPAAINMGEIEREYRALLDV